MQVNLFLLAFQPEVDDRPGSLLVQGFDLYKVAFRHGKRSSRLKYAV